MGYTIWPMGSSSTLRSLRLYVMSQVTTSPLHEPPGSSHSPTTWHYYKPISWAHHARWHILPGGSLYKLADSTGGPILWNTSLHRLGFSTGRVSLWIGPSSYPIDVTPAVMTIDVPIWWLVMLYYDQGCNSYTTLAEWTSSASSTSITPQLINGCNWLYCN